jgi:Mrp family chromosome partitioning ATPase
MTEQERNRLFNEEETRIKQNVTNIKHRIAVFSGKGGVGKTTVSVNIAYGLSVRGLAAGILDADITGPNVAKMLGVEGDAIVLGNQIIPFEKYGAKMISVASLIPSGQPVIWRGPMRSKMISQFLADVSWGGLDYLIADLPPGTGDEILTISGQMKPDCAIIVTTPQEVSTIDAERAINLAKKLDIPFIGVVENMSGFVCPHCSSILNIFGTGGGEKLASDCNVPFLGSIPVDIDARILGDKGVPVILEKPNSEVAKAFESIIGSIKDYCTKAENESAVRSNN